MGHDVLRKVIARVTSSSPAWFAIIANEATDVNYSEQLNISVCYVDDNYNVYEDSIGLYQLSHTDAASITSAIQDILFAYPFPCNFAEDKPMMALQPCKVKDQELQHGSKRKCQLPFLFID